MTDRAWLIPVGGLVAAPLVTWLPMLAIRWPGLPLPAYHPQPGLDLWQAQTYWLVALSLLAALLWPRDRWLAAAVALGGLMIFLRGAALDPTHATLFAFGAVTLGAIRRAPTSVHARVLTVLASAGLFQTLYVLQQAWLKYDVLWGPLFGGQLNPIIQPYGTLGTVDAAAAYIAITAPLMPVWALPLSIAAVWTSQSMGATAALVVGLAVRYGPTLYRHARWSPAVVACGLATAAWYFLTYVKTLDAVWPRLAVWRFGLLDAARTDPVLGYGLGGWATHIPALQVTLRNSPTPELWREAHNEWVQWACELGVVGLVLLGGWLWAHRAMFQHPRVGASLAALAVTCGSFFIFHTVATALLGLVLVGLATPDDPTPVALGG